MNSLTNKGYCNINTRTKVCPDLNSLNQTEQNQMEGNLVNKSLYKQIGRIMKLTFILILFTLMNVYSNGYSQKVTLTGKQAPLEEFFSTIKQQTGYVFFYDLNLLKTAKPVTLKIVDTELSEALAILFDDQPLDYSIENKTIVISQKLSQKEKKALKKLLKPLKRLERLNSNTKQDTESF